MHIPGHIAVALALHCLPPPSNNQLTLKPLLLASLFPDLVDKTIGYIFHLMPSGRHYAHNLFSLLSLSALVTMIWGRTIGYAWFLGYLGHLLADRQTLVPWFFPVKRYGFKKSRFSLAPIQFLREMAFLMLVIVIYRACR